MTDQDYDELLNRLKPKDREFADDIVDMVNHYNDAKKMFYDIKIKTKIYNNGAVKYGVYWLKKGYTTEDFYKVFLYTMSWAKQKGFTPTIENCMRYESFESNLEKAEIWMQKDHKDMRLLAKKIIDWFKELNLPASIEPKDPLLLSKIDKIYTSVGKPEFADVKRAIKWMATWPPEYTVNPITLVKSPEKFSDYLYQAKIYFNQKEVI